MYVYIVIQTQTNAGGQRGNPETHHYVKNQISIPPTFMMNQHHHESAITTAHRLDELARKIGLTDFAVYVSNSGQNYGIQVKALDHSGVPGRQNDMTTSTHHATENELNSIALFFQRFSFLVKEKNENYFSARCEYLEAILRKEAEKAKEKEKRFSNYILKIKALTNVINFNPLFPSKRNASRLRGLGKKVANYKKRNSPK